MKTNVSITLDFDLVAEGRLRNVKFSQIFNTFLREYLAMKDEKRSDLKL